MCSPRVLQRAGATPLWQQLLADLRDRLAAGEFARDFPGELALVEAYGVSRHTVREALRSLRTEGVVSAARGRRPQLTRVDVEQPLGALASLFATVEAGGLEQRSLVRVLEVRADGTVAARLELEESTPLLYLERLRLAGGEPLALDRVWLPAEQTVALLEVDFTRTSLYAELDQRCDIRLSGGSEQIRAVQPRGHERSLLHLPTDAAVLLVDRTGSHYGRPFEVRQTVVRGDRYAVTATYDSQTYQLSPASPIPSTRSLR
ncbi:MAG: GntR family transcriptional regulator [Mycobacteriales bacterium]